MKGLDYQAKQVTYNVYSYFKARKANPKTCEHRKDINLIDTVSLVTGLSKSSVTRIIREGNFMKTQTGSVDFKEKDKKKQIRKKRIEIDDHTESVIRKKVIHFYTVKNEVPSVRKLNMLLKGEKILFCSNEYLRQLLHKLGFTNADQGSEGMLRERADIVSDRLKYLQAIRAFRDENKAIFYFNDIKRWHLSSDAKRKLKHTHTMPSVIILRGSDSGFVDDTVIMIKDQPTTEKENKNLDTATYKWVQTKVLPNIPPSSVVVMNYTYVETAESTQHDEKPTLASTRTVMEEWLIKHKIPFKETDTKADLFAVISNQDKRLECSIDKIVEEAGHKILYLPPNHNELNPATVLWDELKNHAKEKSPKNLLSTLSKAKLEKCLTEVKGNETEYYNHDMKIDDAEHLSKLKNVKEELQSASESDNDMECDDVFLAK